MLRRFEGIMFIGQAFFFFLEWDPAPPIRAAASIYERRGERAQRSERPKKHSVRMIVVRVPQQHVLIFSHHLSEQSRFCFWVFCFNFWDIVLPLPGQAFFLPLPHIHIRATLSLHQASSPPRHATRCPSPSPHLSASSSSPSDRPIHRPRSPKVCMPSSRFPFHSIALLILSFCFIIEPYPMHLSPFPL